MFLLFAVSPAVAYPGGPVEARPSFGGDSPVLSVVQCESSIKGAQHHRGGGHGGLGKLNANCTNYVVGCGRGYCLLFLSAYPSPFHFSQDSSLFFFLFFFGIRWGSTCPMPTCSYASVFTHIGFTHGFKLLDMQVTVMIVRTLRNLEAKLLFGTRMSNYSFSSFQHKLYKQRLQLHTIDQNFTQLEMFIKVLIKVSLFVTKLQG